MVDLGIKVKELYALCAGQIKRGNGDKHILISDDDEGNGFHTLFCGFTEEVEDFLSLEHDRTHNKDNCIILG